MRNITTYCVLFLTFAVGCGETPSMADAGFPCEQDEVLTSDHRCLSRDGMPIGGYAFPCQNDQVLKKDGTCMTLPAEWTFPCGDGETLDSDGACVRMPEEWVFPCVVGEVLNTDGECMPVPAVPDNPRRVKGTTLTTVYLIGRDGYRHAFPDQQTYFSWFHSFAGIETISDEEIADIPFSDNITIRPGTWLIKIQSDPKSYAIEPGGVIRWIETENVAFALYGPNWNLRWVLDVPDAFFVFYTVGPPITTNTYPTGTILRTMQNGLYYVRGNSILRVSPSTAEALRLQSGFWITIPDSLLQNYQDGGDLVPDYDLAFPY